MRIRWDLEPSFRMGAVVYSGNFSLRCFPQEKPMKFLKDLLSEVA